MLVIGIGQLDDVPHLDVTAILPPDNFGGCDSRFLAIPAEPGQPNFCNRSKMRCLVRGLAKSGIQKCREARFTARRTLDAPLAAGKGV